MCSYVWHDSCIRSTILVLMFICVTSPHSYVRHYLFTCWHVWHDSFIRATSRVHMFTRVTSLIYMCDVTCSYVRTCDMTRSYVQPCFSIYSHVWYDWLIRVTWLSDMTRARLASVFHSPTCKCLTWLTHMQVSSVSITSLTWLVDTCDMTQWNDARSPCLTGNTLQHTATHCNTLQHTATHCSTPITSPCLTGRIPGFHLTHPHASVWHNSFTSVTWPVHAQDMTRWHGTRLPCFRELIQVYDMTHSHVWHDSLIRVTWLSDMARARLASDGAQEAMMAMRRFVAVCCSVLHVLQCVAVYCSVLQCVAGGYRMEHKKPWWLCKVMLRCVAVCCSVL